ncbi:MAG: PDZ domain-containing protein [Solirubrobacteraceae bacterium MAG38_C4-C5]|nr:PDZ domain-containing protein [Candidatus Siliceabacter maunaloa]
MRRCASALPAWPAASVAPRRLGVAVAPPALARRMRRAVGLPERDGLLVHAVEDTSPAASAGLQRGDLLVAAQGRDLGAGTEQLYAALDALETGAGLTLRVVRGTEERDVAVTFAAPTEAVEASQHRARARPPRRPPRPSAAPWTPTPSWSWAWPSGSRPPSPTCGSPAACGAAACGRGRAAAWCSPPTASC